MSSQTPPSRRDDTPSWSPPSGVFGSAWTVLHTLNGIVGWRIAGHRDEEAFAVHVGQLAVNTAWSPLFFAAEMRWPHWAPTGPWM